ncbi:MAG TPA: SGNH/GDSL hydrolase family protein, partial [Lapillicoccus sp.]|nr:SGNH/GDSL hydrolase family protein [Lapillicoccus sp.]
AEPTGPEGILATITTPPPTSTPAPRPAQTSTSAASADGWYLALGDSLAAGNQPSGDQPERGYAGPVLDGLRKTNIGIQLRNLGCTGETTSSMLGGGKCRYPEGSQIAAAVAFLKANADKTRLVTLDIGANNVLDCAGTGSVDQACAARDTLAAARELGQIMGQIRGAAPKVPIVLLTYYNPLLAAWRQGDEGKKVAAQSQPLLGGLNVEITKAAKAVGAKVADVAGEFATNDTGGSPQPNNVTRICDWTWMCARRDIHANDAGYAAMAKAVLAAR